MSELLIHNPTFWEKVSYEEKNGCLKSQIVPSLDIKAQKDFPPSSVSLLGYADIGSKIQSMIRDGNLDAHSLINDDDDQVFDEDGNPSVPDEKLVFDESSDVSFDKIDAFEKQEEIVTRIHETSGNLADVSRSGIKNSKETLKTSETKSHASGEGSGDTSPDNSEK